MNTPLRFQHILAGGGEGQSLCWCAPKRLQVERPHVEMFIDPETGVFFPVETDDTEIHVVFMHFEPGVLPRGHRRTTRKPNYLE